MLRQFMQMVQGGSGYGIISTILFMAYFFLMVFYALRMNREEEVEFSRIPLDELPENVKKETE